MKEINWSELTHFNDKQKLAEQAVNDYKYVLYGGAVGGGKSYWIRWMLIKLLLQWAAKGYKGIVVGLFCEDYPSLKDRHASKMAYELPKWLGDLKDDKVYGLSFVLKPQFGSGVIALRNLDDPSKYASSEFAAIAIDEITKNNYDTYQHLRMRLRWAGIDDTKFIAGTNPGGIGHAWVKKIWMDKEFEPNEKEAHRFQYIKATAYDNPHLDENYYSQLEGLPEDKRKAFLEGDWNLFEGQFFSEWREHIHVVEPFPIPSTWRRFGGFDFGRTNPFAFYWFAVDFDGNCWVYKEYYQAGSEADENAKNVMSINGDDYLNYVVGDNSIFSKQGFAETIADIMRKNGIGKAGGNMPLLLPSTKDRIAGWTLMHQYLAHHNGRLPRIRFFSTCKNAIKTIPSLIHDKHKVEDLDSDGEDHAADAIRYFLQTLKDKQSPSPETDIQRKIELFNQKLNANISNNTINRFNHV